MVKVFSRLTCDRCGFYSDFNNEKQGMDAGWALNDNAISTLCPDCTDVKKMINEAFMQDKPFALRCESNKRPRMWRITN